MNQEDTAPRPIELLHLNDTIAVTGEASSVEVSDPDTEDYFASSEGSEHDLSPLPGGPTARTMVRADSKTPHFPEGARLAPPVQPSKQSHIHPALRTGPCIPSDDAASSSPPPSASLYRGTRDRPIYIPPTPASARRLSSIFHFGGSGSNSGHEGGGSYAFNVCTPTLARRSSGKLSSLRSSLSNLNLNLSGRLRRFSAAAAGTKHARSPGASDTDGDSARAKKATKRPIEGEGEGEIHCQTCSCRAAVCASLAAHRTDGLPLRQDASASPLPQPLSPPPPCGIRKKVEYCVARSPAPSGVAAAAAAGGHSVGARNIYQHDATLAILEGRDGRARHAAPAALRRDLGVRGEEVFTESEKGRLRGFIARAAVE